MNQSAYLLLSEMLRLVSQTLSTARPLRILVLGDAEAAICRAAASMNYDVYCCPNLQLPSKGSAAHSETIYETFEELVDQDVSFDIAVALDGWHRIVKTTPPKRLSAWIDWIRLHATFGIFEAIRNPVAPDLNELGPFAVTEQLKSFRFLSEFDLDEFGTSLATPWVLASDFYLLSEGLMIAGSEVEVIGSTVADSDMGVTRTFKVPGPRIMKVESVSPDYFERSQVFGEFSFLSSVGEEEKQALELPRVHSFVRGRAVSILVRDFVAGCQQPDAPKQIQIAELLRIAGEYSRRGIYHNDLRPWNFLWNNRRAVLVDFADASRSDNDTEGVPQVMTLAGCILSVLGYGAARREKFAEHLLQQAHLAGIFGRWQLNSLFGEPWFRVTRLVSLEGDLAQMSGHEAIRSILEVTVD